MPEAIEATQRLEVPPITVRLRAEGGLIGEGTLEAASGGQFTTVFDGEATPRLAIGHEGLMTVQGGGCTALVHYQVVSREDSAEAITYTMKSNIAPGQTWGFARTRRGLQRVVPASAIPVGISAHGLHAEGRLLDISRGGAAVLVSMADEVALSSVDRMDLRMLLPGNSGEREIAVPSVLVNRRQESTAVRYGFVFDLGMALHDAEVTEVLAAYVHQRQVEMIRALKDLIDQQL